MVNSIKNISQIAGEMIAKPVLEYLENKDKTKKYKVKGTYCGDNVKIFEYNPSSIFRSIFPKKIVHIFDNSNGYCKPNIISLYESTISQKKLEELLKDINFNGISMGAAFTSRQEAADYF